ncbi:hypothetical protein P7C70_g3890, partial [Phenoliferia sp. Uapishka_3]
MGRQLNLRFPSAGGSRRNARLYAALGSDAGNFNPADGVSASQETVLQAMADERLVLFKEFLKRLKAGTIVYIVSTTILIIVNVVGGVKLLSTLRRVGGARLVPVGTPIVAPLTLFNSDTASPGRLERAQSNDSYQSTQVDDVEGRVRKLEWDTILFFVAVLPSCVAFIGFSWWVSTHYIIVLTHASLLEFASIGMIWIYTCFVIACMSAMTIKIVLRQRHARRQAAKDISRFGTQDSFPFPHARKSANSDMKDLDVDLE